MSTQRQIPGGPFVNETATAQRQIPNGPFVNETASAGIPDITAVYADNTSTSSVDLRVTLDYA